MKVFRYITSTEHERIQQTGILASREGLDKKPIYGLPDDPLAWGLEKTRNLLGWIRPYVWFRSNAFNKICH